MTVKSTELTKAMRSLERWIEFRPSYDKRHTIPSKNYGVHGVDMCWYLRGPEGVIQFLVFTGWMLPEVQKEFERSSSVTLYPLPADVGYHASTPQYEGQSEMECSLLPQGKCYYDGSGLYAEKVFALLVREGHESVWKKLEDVYQDRFHPAGRKALKDGQ